MTATDLDALLAAVRRNPAEDVPRLMYADALEERGDPGRAGYIRAVLGLHPAPAPLWLSPGEEFGAVMFVDGKVTEVRDLAPGVPGVSYRVSRGFIDRVQCRAAVWLEHGPRIVRMDAAAVEVVALSDREPDDGSTPFPSWAWWRTVTDWGEYRKNYPGEPSAPARRASPPPR